MSFIKTQGNNLIILYKNNIENNYFKGDIKWVEVELEGFGGGGIDMIKIIAGNYQRINNKSI